MSYLRGAGAVGTRPGAEDTSRVASTRRDWPATDGPAAGAAAIGGSVVGPAAPARGEEERRTQGLKLCPPRVRSMFG